jgi:hypothetical protein
VGFNFGKPNRISFSYTTQAQRAILSRFFILSGRVGVKINVFIVIAVPFIIVASALVRLLYLQIRRPSPVALGSAFPKMCVVNSDEIHEYRDDRKSDTASYWQPGTQWKQVRVTRKYIGPMTCNTKLFQQVARFEVLKINPSKSSIDYSPRETLALSLADEAAAVRWLLIKGQIGIAVRAVSGIGIREEAVERLLQLTREYKQLEQDFVALVGMATDDCCYAMLIERLGLSNWWGLIEGGSSGS